MFYYTNSVYMGNMEVEKKKNGKETYTRLTYHDIKIKVNFKEILFFFFFFPYKHYYSIYSLSCVCIQGN